MQVCVALQNSDVFGGCFIRTCTSAASWRAASDASNSAYICIQMKMHHIKTRCIYIHTKVYIKCIKVYILNYLRCLQTYTRVHGSEDVPFFVWCIHICVHEGGDTGM